MAERRRAEASLRSLAAQLSAAEDAERRRVAHDIHDAVSQMLGVVKLNLQTAVAETPDGCRPNERVADVIGVVDDLIRQTRDLTFDLHPAMLDDFGLVPTLAEFAGQFGRRTSTDVTVTEVGGRPDPPPPPAVASYLFRATKEVISNAVRHGRAREMVVTVHWPAGGAGPRPVRVVVDDDGGGFDPASAVAPHARPRAGPGRHRRTAGRAGRATPPGERAGAGRPGDPGGAAGRTGAGSPARGGDGSEVVSRMVLNVLIAEDHTLVRSGIRALLESSPDVAVVGEAGNGRQAVELARALHPGLVLMDVGMAELNGIDAARQIHAGSPDVRIVMLSMHEDRQYVFESLKAGAAGYVLKGAAFEELLSAIRTVMDGRNYISPALAGAVMDDYISRAQGRHRATSELGRLSGREREVLQLIAEGRSSAEVAERLRISVRTVDTHRHNIMVKLEIHSIAGLTKFAIRHGLAVLN